jgi:membrane protein required for colicin V production
LPETKLVYKQVGGDSRNCPLLFFCGLELMQGMSLVDIIIWGILLAFAAKGFLKGLVREVCSLLGLVAGVWGAVKYSASLAGFTKSFIHLPSHVASALSFAGIFLIISLLFFLVGNLLTVVFKIMLLGGINKVGGIVFGLMEGAFILCMALYFCTGKMAPGKLRNHLLSSPTGRSFSQTGREIVSGWENSTKPEMKGK